MAQWFYEGKEQLFFLGKRATWKAQSKVCGWGTVTENLIDGK